MPAPGEFRSYAAIYTVSQLRYLLDSRQEGMQALMFIFFFFVGTTAALLKGRVIVIDAQAEQFPARFAWLTTPAATSPEPPRVLRVYGCASSLWYFSML